MSKADDMFKELGYRKVDTELNFILAQYKTGQNIIQFFENKNFAIYEIYEHETVYISMNLLKAINEKCKELGWLDE